MINDMYEFAKDDSIESHFNGLVKASTSSSYARENNTGSESTISRENQQKVECTYNLERGRGHLSTTLFRKLQRTWAIALCSGEPAQCDV